jgi:hypothetical protein
VAWLDGRKLPLSLGRKVRRKAVIDHFLAGRRCKIEVVVGHER